MSTSAPSGNGGAVEGSGVTRGSTTGSASQMAWREHRRELIHYDELAQTFLQLYRMVNKVISLFSVTLGPSVRAAVPPYTFVSKDTTAEHHTLILTTMHTWHDIRKWISIAKVIGAKGKDKHEIENAILRDAESIYERCKFGKHYKEEC